MISTPSQSSPLYQGEWSTTELGAARGIQPESVLKIVSTLSSTHDGWLALVIVQCGKRFEISGVIEPGKLRACPRAQSAQIHPAQQSRSSEQRYHLTQKPADTCKPTRQPKG